MPCKFPSQLALFQKVIVLEKPVAREVVWGPGISSDHLHQAWEPMSWQMSLSPSCLSPNWNALSHFAETKYMYTHYLNLCKDLILKMVKDDMWRPHSSYNKYLIQQHLHLRHIFKYNIFICDTSYLSSVFIPPWYTLEAKLSDSVFLSIWNTYVLFIYFLCVILWSLLFTYIK